jgi:hypothetical protein
MSPSLRFPQELLDRFAVGVRKFGITYVPPTNGEQGYFFYKDHPGKVLLYVKPTERGMMISRAKNPDKMGRTLLERAELSLAIFKRNLA